MRLFLAGLGIIYGLAGWSDTQFLKSLQKPSIESAFPDGLPGWIGISTLIADFDHTD